MSSNPQHLIDLALGLVKERYDRDSTQAPPLVLACRDDEIMVGLELNFADDFTKDMSITIADMFLKMNEADASIHISEAWMSEQPASQEGGYVPASKSPNRVEVLICEVSSPDHYVSVVQRMNRGESGNLIDFSELHRVDSHNLVGATTVQSRFDFFEALKGTIN